MTEKNFIKKQNKLTSYIKESLKRENIKENEISSLNILLKLVMEYTYSNRLELKGILKHTIIDSLEIEDDNLVNKVFKFEDSL